MTSRSENAATTKRLQWAILVGVLSLGAGLALAIFGPDVRQARAWGNSSYSSSAVGHLGFRTMLEELDIPVLTRRTDRDRMRSSEALWVVVEPDADTMKASSEETLRGVAYESANTLVVLPKRSSSESFSKRGWIRRAHLMPEDDVKRSVEFLDFEWLDIVRASVPKADAWTVNRLGFTPTFPTSDDAQFFKCHDMDPLLECEHGMLIGERTIDDQRLVIIADPDLIANAGLGRGHNAVLVMNALERARPPDAPVMIDEVVHGFRSSPSIWQELFSFPLVLLTLHGLLVLGLLVWNGSKRFGRAAEDETPYQRSQRFLVENTADLMQLRAGHASTLRDYLATSIQAVRAQLGMPVTLQGEEAERWLNRASENRGVKVNVTELRAQVAQVSERRRSQHAVLVCADRIHHWRQEMVHGP